MIFSFNICISEAPVASCGWLRKMYNMHQLKKINNLNLYVDFVSFQPKRERKRDREMALFDLQQCLREQKTMHLADVVALVVSVAQLQGVNTINRSIYCIFFHYFPR